jgi:competence protein ComEC
MALLRDASGSYTLLSPASPSSFTLQQWLPALGDARRPDDPTLRQRAHCDRKGCTGTLPDGRNVALSLTPEAARLDCQRAQIVITPVKAEPALCGPDRLLLSAESFARHGAQKIHLRDGRIAARETSLDPRKTRPWRHTPPPMTEEPEPGPIATGFPERPTSSPQRPRAPERPEPEEDPALAPQ